MRRTLFLVLAGAVGLVAPAAHRPRHRGLAGDPNEFVAPLQARIELATGRDVSIGSGIELKVSLTPRLVVHEFALANAPWGMRRRWSPQRNSTSRSRCCRCCTSASEVIRVNLVEPSMCARDRCSRAHKSGTSAAGPAERARAGDTPSPAAFGVGNVAVTNGVRHVPRRQVGVGDESRSKRLRCRRATAQAPVSVEFGKADDGPWPDRRAQSTRVSSSSTAGPIRSRSSGEIGGQEGEPAAKLRSGSTRCVSRNWKSRSARTRSKARVTVTTGGARPRYAVKPDRSGPDIGRCGEDRSCSGESNRSRARIRTVPVRFLRRLAAARDAAHSRRGGGCRGRALGRVANAPSSMRSEIRFTLQDGRLDVPMLKAATFGGHVDAHASLGVPASGAPVLAVVIDARNLDLGAELAALRRAARREGARRR